MIYNILEEASSCKYDFEECSFPLSPRVINFVLVSCLSVCNLWNIFRLKFLSTFGNKNIEMSFWANKMKFWTKCDGSKIKWHYSGLRIGFSQVFITPRVKFLSSVKLELPVHGHYRNHIHEKYYKSPLCRFLFKML